MEINGKKILVTGATGMLGSHVVKRLSEEGRDVRVMMRHESNHHIDNAAIEVVYGDITSPKEVDAAVKNISLIFHCAALISYLKKDRKKIFQTNVGGTRNILEAALRNNVEKVIHISSVSAENPKGAYALSKAASENICKEYQEKGLNVMVIRQGTIYGSGDFHGNSVYPFQQVMNSEIIIVPPGGKSYIDIDDAVSGLILAAKQGVRNGAYIFTSENHSFLNVYKMIAKAEDKKIYLLKTPRFIYPIVKLFLSFSEYDSGLADLVCKERFFLHEDLTNQLNWRPQKTIQKSIVEMFNFYKSVKLI